VDLGAIGTGDDAMSVCQILGQLLIFSTPCALPVSAETINYASVVFVGFWPYVELLGEKTTAPMQVHDSFHDAANRVDHAARKAEAELTIY
jgi:hypothetical protein